MSNNAHRFSNKKYRKVAGESDHVPKPKFAEERHTVRQKTIVPKGNNQKTYLRMLESLTLVVASGYAGCGKSYIPCIHAANLLLADKIDKIVLVRPYTQLENKTIGFSKGTDDQKLMPYMLPMIGYLKEVLGAATVDIMLDDGRIVLQKLESIRGMNFANSYVICDEMQGTTPSEIKAITTRIGDNCTMVLMGDSRQNDIKRGEDGISFISRILATHEIRDSGVVEFGIDDIVRSGICKDFVIAYDKEGWN